jgi:hypothetical protein
MNTEPNTTQTGRCKTCKHWTRCTRDIEIRRFGGQHVGKCESPKFVHEVDAGPAQDGLSYWDYEECGAGFETGEDFGCVHWVAA